MIFLNFSAFIKWDKWHCHAICVCPPHLTPLTLRKAFKHPAVKHGLAGAFGYCLGGQSCLEQVRAGHPIQASWHGRGVMLGNRTKTGGSQQKMSMFQPCFGGRIHQHLSYVFSILCIMLTYNPPPQIFFSDLAQKRGGVSIISSEMF